MRTSRTPLRRSPKKPARGKSKKRYHLHIAAASLVFAGFGVPAMKILSVPVHMASTAVSAKVFVSGSPNLPVDVKRIVSQSASPEIAKIIAPQCGNAKPLHAPDECGSQQWTGYSETNPAAAAWLAIANTGKTSCRATITRLELSYRTESADRTSATRTILSSDINGIQFLTDGTQTAPWGSYLHDLVPGSTFTIPANAHGYVHPFGPIVAVPEDATELTMSFAVSLTGGCVASGGIDTFEENAIPNTDFPYTKNGSVTDFIKEAIKTPWVTRSVNADEPISYSITRLPRSERTGWQKTIPDIE